MHSRRTINLLTLFLLNIIILSSISAYEFSLPKTFFINPSTGEPDVIIVVGATANASEVVSASLLAAAIANLSGQNIDPIDLIKLDAEINTATLNKNLILVGYPVSNSIVRNLMNMGAFTVNWSTSTGEWEWISDPFGRGYDVLIVAGANTDATRFAVQSLVSDLISLENKPNQYIPSPSTSFPVSEPLPPTITQTLDPSTRNKLAETNKILFDKNYEIMEPIILSGKEYVIVNYNNAFSSCNGIEIISSEGMLVEDSSLAKNILRKYSWVKASKELSESDLKDIERILNSSEDIYDILYPISTITDAIVNSVEIIENNFLLNIGWNALQLIYPELKTIVDTIQNINLVIEQWIKASEDIKNSLPEVISELKTLRSGGDVPEDIEGTLNNGISSLNKMDDKVNEVNSYVDNARSELNNFIQLTNSYGSIQKPLKNLDNNLKSFQDTVEIFSNSMNLQSSNLQKVISNANSNLDTYQYLWNNRRNALTRIYTYIGIIVASLFFLLIIIFLIYRKSKRKSNGEKEPKIEERIQEEFLCKSCGNILEKDWISCPKCGYDIKKNCPSCGNPVEIDWVKCPKCGKELI